MDDMAELARKLAQMKAELDREVRLLRAASMGEHCRCGVHASDCLMDKYGDCPVEDQEMEESMPAISDLINNARAHVQEARLRIRDLPAQVDMSRVRVTLDALDADLNALARLSSRQGE